MAAHRARTPVVGLLLALTGVCACPRPPQTDEVQIRSLLAQLATAKSGEDVADLYDPSAVMWDINPGEFRGKKAIADRTASQARGFRDVACKSGRMTILPGPKLAVAYGTLHCTGISKTGEKNMDLVGRDTVVLRRTNDRWLVIHRHISLPLGVEDGKALRQSK